MIGILLQSGADGAWFDSSNAGLVGGIGALGVGLYALATGQPYHVWYPFALMGFILAVVLGSLLPVVRRRYAQAEQRRIDAEALRRG